jgi:predicted LPLAT superfamily acyltransferase/uncharacterized protein (DUF2062 family)
MATAVQPLRPLCVFPVYNHAATLPPLVREARARMADVLVVDDGSTDADLADLLAGADVTVVRHATNRGKGAALLTALAFAREHGFSHLVALDADGQHAPADLPRFLEAIRRAPQALVLGVRDFAVPHVPRSSRFGRAFSNFWIAIETGVVCADTQCGFRAYPVAHVSQLPLAGRRYDFEVEVLARGFWAGLPLAEVPVATWYAPPGSRISHFHKVRDNLRLSRTHARLVLRRLWPWPVRRLVPRAGRPAWRERLHPGRLLRRLLREHASPAGLGVSAGVGTLLAVLPIPGLHSLAILYVTTRLSLNRLMALAIQNLFIPPFTPGLCIIVGHLVLHGQRLPSLPRTPADVLGYLVEWLAGALLLAPLLALVTGWLVFLAARRIQRGQAPDAGARPAAPRRRGNALGFGCFRLALRLTGLRGAYGLLYFVCAYYALFDRTAVAAAGAYVRRRFPGAGRLGRRLAVYRLFISQGRCLIDRHADLAGARRFTFDTRPLQEILQRPEVADGGFLLLLAHAGGWQLALPQLRRLPGGRPVSLLMRAAESPDVAAHLRAGDAGFHVIPPETGPAGALEMVTRLQRGEIVSIMGDRAYGGQTVAVPFLGGRAGFPAGAFAIARAAQRPLVALFVPKTGVTRYGLEAVLFPPPARESRTAVRDGVRAFAEALEQFTLRHPFQCFLFEDLWSGHG